MNDQNLPQKLIDAFQRLVTGDYSYRLPRTFAGQDEDALASSFNTVVQGLENIIRDMQAKEQRLNQALDNISAALMSRPGYRRHCRYKAAHCRACKEYKQFQ